MNIKVKIIVSTLVVFILFLAGYIFLSNSSYLHSPISTQAKPTHTTTIKGHVFYVFLAQSPAEKEKGLSGRRSLSQDEGMLFTFSQPDYYAFWMKDMEFPIDIIYLKGNTIVTIYSNAAAPKNSQTSLTIYRPLQTSSMVLEINAGLSHDYGFKIGDTVIIQ